MRDDWRYAQLEYGDPCECPKCGEITLIIENDGEARCLNDQCKHYEIHSPKPDPKPTYKEGFMLRKQAN